MSRKPTYKELEQRIKDLEEERDKRKNSEEALKESEKRYRDLFNNSTDFIYTTDLNGNFTDVNKAAEDITGYTKNDLIGMNYKDYTPEDFHTKIFKVFNKVFTEGKPLKDFPLEVTVKGGEKKYLESCVSPLRKGTEIIGFHGSSRDITERKRFEEELNQRMRQATLAAEIGTILVQSIDLHKLLQLCTESIIKHLDAAFARIWILNEQTNILELKASAGMYTHLDGEHGMISMGQYKIGLIAQEKKPQLTNDLINDPRTSDLEWAKRAGMVAFAGHPLIVANKLVGVMAIFSKQPLQHAALTALASISDEIALGITRKKGEDQIHFLAYYDSITGLPNRYLFREILKKAIESADRYKQAFAIALIDLDDFSRINDTLGHILGDKFLKIYSSRLLKILRTSDHIARISDTDEFMARMGGDEFVVLLYQVDDAGKAGHVVQRILHEMSRPYELDGREIFVTSSVGIVIYPNDGKDVEDLLKNTDSALYHAKKKGKNSFKFYSESMNKAAIEILTMEAGLRRALEQEEFLVYYQPKTDLRTRKIIGMEALIRWKTPEGNMIPPAKFIPVAEENGLIVPIGNFVLQTACLQNQKWHEAGTKKISVAVNVSGLQFGQKNFVQDILTALNNTGFDPYYLELEVTETTVMTDPEKATHNLNRLKKAGIRISLDDFGTGYSSLNYLQQLPIDTMKIDISFIRNVLSNPNDAVIVKTIIAMAHNLNLKVVTEGVEDKHQLNFLEEHQCDIIQGYFFSPPVPAERFEELLRAEA
jgi:diguanylate cyclase (GGDEF)-like protein/PAS domain S-box-containing protein